MIYRVKKDKNYTIVDNKYLFNKSLSLGAIGLFTIILSGPTLLSNINTNTIYDKIDKTKMALNHLTEFLVKEGLISIEDTSLFDYNNFILELLSKEDYELVVKSIKYTTNYMLKHDFKDENYLPINNKFGYFKTSVINNIEKLKSSDVPLYDDNFFD